MPKPTNTLARFWRGLRFLVEKRLADGRVFPGNIITGREWIPDVIQDLRERWTVQEFSVALEILNRYYENGGEPSVIIPDEIRKDDAGIVKLRAFPDLKRQALKPTYVVTRAIFRAIDSLEPGEFPLVDAAVRNALRNVEDERDLSKVFTLEAKQVQIGSHSLIIFSYYNLDYDHAARSPGPHYQKLDPDNVKWRWHILFSLVRSQNSQAMRN